MGEMVPVDQKIKTIGSELQSPAWINQIRMALPRGMTPERLARIVTTELRRVPMLAECTRESFFGAVLTCAQLGLEPGVLGQAWIIPFKNQKEKCIEAQLLIGYRGMVALAWRSAQIKSIQAHVVYEGDAFEWEFGLNPKLYHKPASQTFDPAKALYTYAVIKTATGGELFDVMTKAEVEAVRARSAAGQSGPWVTDWAPMACKTVLRRLLKLAPASVEMQRAMGLDDAADRGESQDFAPEIDVTPVPPVPPAPPAKPDQSPASKPPAGQPNDQKGAA